MQLFSKTQIWFFKYYCLCKISLWSFIFSFFFVSVDLCLDLYFRTFTSLMEFNQLLPHPHRSREIICFPVWIFDLFLPVESVTIDFHLGKPFRNACINQRPASIVFTSVTWVILSCTSQVMESASEIATVCVYIKVLGCVVYCLRNVNCLI